MHTHCNNSITQYYERLSIYHSQVSPYLQVVPSLHHDLSFQEGPSAPMETNVHRYVVYALKPPEGSNSDIIIFVLNCTLIPAAPVEPRGPLNPAGP